MDETELPPHLEALGQALPALGAGAMLLSELDGFLTAVLVCPEPIPAEEWLPMVFVYGDEGVDHVEETPQVVDVVAKILARHAEIAAELASEHGCRPLYDVDDRSGEELWEIWAEAFEAGMSLRPEAWESFAKAQGDAREALNLLITLLDIARDDAETKAEIGANGVRKLIEAAPDLLPACVNALATGRSSGTSPIVRGPKIGRNDPCPCGSGRKHKKCCGAN